MSYGSTSAPAKRGGSGFVFLIVIAIGLFLMFSKRGGAPNGASETGIERRPSSNDGLGSDHDGPTSLPENFGGGGDFEARPMPTTGRSGTASDWNLEDAVSTNKSADKSSTLPQQTTKPSNGDWSIEDVSGKSKDNQFQFSNPQSGQNAEPKPPGGDWSIEDAGTNKTKKTEKGDWSIDD